MRFAPWINATTRVLTLQNEVFNFTSVGHANPSPISGRGSINLAETDQYQFTPPCGSPSYPGNCVPLADPATVRLRVQSSDPNGVPTEAISYDLGNGWVSEDAISFPSLAGRVDQNFVVNGTSRLTGGPFADAEFVLGGPYAGLTQTNRGSSISMTLSYWNGHNLAAVPDPWDFGADGSNGIQNTSVTLGSVGGAPAAATVAGAGTLGPLYNTSTEARIDLAPLPANGTVLLRGVAANYTGGSAQFELVPGPCEIDLVVNGSRVASTNVSLRAGEDATIVLAYDHAVLFRELGLPAGTSWSIRWDGARFTSTSTTLSLESMNGSHQLMVDPVPGFLSDLHGAEEQVHGPLEIDLNWTAFLWPARFVAQGLPSGTLWWVVAGGASNRTGGPMVVLPLANGTQPYLVGCDYRFVPDPSAGNVSIAGTSSNLTVQFGERLGWIAGTVRPGSAQVLLDGSPITAPTGSFNVSVAPGPHLLNASSEGYLPVSEWVEATPGNTTVVAIGLNSSAPAPTAGAASAWVAGIVGSAAVAIVGAATFVYLRARRQRRSAP